MPANVCPGAGGEGDSCGSADVQSDRASRSNACTVSQTVERSAILNSVVDGSAIWPSTPARSITVPVIGERRYERGRLASGASVVTPREARLARAAPHLVVGSRQLVLGLLHPRRHDPLCVQGSFALESARRARVARASAVVTSLRPAREFPLCSVAGAAPTVTRCPHPNRQLNDACLNRRADLRIRVPLIPSSSNMLAASAP